jgi:hypothetical protein
VAARAFAKAGRRPERRIPVVAVLVSWNDVECVPRANRQFDCCN